MSTNKYVVDPPAQAAIAVEGVGDLVVNCAALAKEHAAA